VGGAGQEDTWGRSRLRGYRRIHFVKGEISGALRRMGVRSRNFGADNQHGCGWKSDRREKWRLASGNGDTVEFEIDFLRGALTRNRVETKVFSALKPGFYRIYRIDEAVELFPVEGRPSDDGRIRKLGFKARGTGLTRLFDGSEQLVSIASIPWFTRLIYLPRP
jgi:hypothetical protein